MINAEGGGDLASNQEIFRDTLKRIENDTALAGRTRQLLSETMLYKEGFQSLRTPIRDSEAILFEEMPALSAVRKHRMGTTAVLNFASHTSPGGGVWKGANAQEEYLCRATNLYPSLASGRAADYYKIHGEIKRKSPQQNMFLATDMVIYSPHVTVFRKDAEYIPGKTDKLSTEYTDDWYEIDVLTCSAPSFRHPAYVMPERFLYGVFEKRITNIFEVAIENRVDTLILGAFGCGAFHNPPAVVASAFQRVLHMPRYAKAFDKVVFAVIGKGMSVQNVNIFREMFGKEKEG